MAASPELVESALLCAVERRSTQDVLHRTSRRGRALAAMAAGVALAAAAACAATHAFRGGVAAANVAAGVSFVGRPEPPPSLRCTLPEDFCRTSPTGVDRLTFRDCDGDGELDPYCEGGEPLRFGYLSSRNGCRNTWPDGSCDALAGRAAENEITIIHFGDVYEVSGVLDKGIRRGGMARAAHVIKEARRRNPKRTFAVFAGDFLSPSALSDLFEGAQMVDVLNDLSLDAASLGNHEFDFGVDVLSRRIAESKFPWLNVNLYDNTGSLLNGTQRRVIRDVPFTPVWGTEEKSSRVCLFGGTYDVRETMFKDKERVQYRNVFQEMEKEAKHLRDEERCDVVLAMSHQTSRDDCTLSKNLGRGVDLILGGHDHYTERNTVCGHAPFLKSDMNLKTHWIVTLRLDEEGKVASVDGEVISLTDADPVDRGVHGKVTQWEDRGSVELDRPIGCTAESLDAISSHICGGETNLGDFVTDAVRARYGTEVAMVNGGAIRGDRIFERGHLSIRQLVTMHPYGNAIVTVRMTGAEIKNFIAKHLVCYQDRCGNFVQISGLRYVFDSARRPAERLISVTRLDGAELGDGEELSVAMTDYMLSTSAYRHNKLHRMTSPNDAVPLMTTLFQAAKRVKHECIAPKADGRIKHLSEG